MKKRIYFLILITLISISFVSASLFGKTTGKVTYSALDPDIKAGGYDGPISIAYDTTTYLTWSIPPSSLPPSPIPGILLAGNCWIISDDGISGNTIPVVNYNGALGVGPLKNPTTYSLSCNGVTRDSVFVNVIQPAPKNNTCIDSDNGTNPDTFGMLTGYYNGNSFFINDSCVSNNSVKEGFCWYDMPNTTILNCNNGCSNGTCLINPNNTNQSGSPAANNTNQTCTEGNSNVAQLMEGESWTPPQFSEITIVVIETEENNTGISVKLSINGQEVTFMRQTFFTQITIAGQVYTIEILSASSTFATIRVTCGIKNLSSSCTDSDGGRNYYTKGTITSYQGGSLARAIDDACVETSLLEGYCRVDNTSTIEIYPCPRGCLDGACIIDRNDTNNSNCKEGDSNTKEIAEGDAAEILGVGIAVLSADETNLKISATLNVAGQTITLSTDGDYSMVTSLENGVYTIELVSASDDAATIRVTCGSIDTSQKSCKEGDSDTKEIAVGDADLVLNLGVSVLDANETNTQLAARLNVGGQMIILTDEAPVAKVVIADQTYTIELLSTSNTSATIRVTCGDINPSLWIDIIAFFRRIFGVG